MADATNKLDWALNYLYDKAPKTYSEVTKRSTHNKEKEVAEYLQQLEHTPEHTEAIRKMRLAWNSHIHREKQRQAKKKGYLFTMSINIEPKLRKLAKPGETLSDTVERLIFLGIDLEKTLRKESESKIKKAKDDFEKSYSKVKRHLIVKPKLDKTIAALKSDIDLLSKQSEENSLLECRRKVLLQSHGLLDAELTNEQEQKALSLFRKGR